MKRTHSVKDVLARISPVLAPIAKQEIQQKSWKNWLENRLDKTLVSKITGVVERDGSLVIFTESAAWSARVKFAVADVEQEIRDMSPHLTSISVRVMPRTAGTKGM